METKRLHIAGLTPSISKDDLTKRLSLFGTVKSLDGFGLLDGVGQPRKFAYATMEGTPAMLAKCVNVLSGSLYKGTKLRLGDAKPEFNIRLQNENEKAKIKAALKDLRKKRLARLRFKPYTAIHSTSMTPITKDEAKKKGAWVVTEMGRVYRPLKIRPEKPLGPPLVSASASASATASVVKNSKGKGKEGVVLKKRTRVKKPDLRARRRKIDMTKWGSTYITGRFLDTEDIPGMKPAQKVTKPVFERIVDDDDDESTTDEEDTVQVEDTTQAELFPPPSPIKAHTLTPSPSLPPSPLPPIKQAPAKTKQPPAPSPVPISVPIPTPEEPPSELDKEKLLSLSLLASLFGAPSKKRKADDVDDWIGKETFSDEEEEEEEGTKKRKKVSRMPVDLDVNHDNGNWHVGGADDEFEVVPKERSTEVNLFDRIPGMVEVGEAEGDENEPDDEEKEESEEEESEDEMEVDEPASELKVAQQLPQESERKQEQNRKETKLKESQVKLKDLFAPREEEAGFSLLGHLDLELDLDEEVPFPIAHEETEPPTFTSSIHEPPSSSIPIPIHSTTAVSTQRKYTTQTQLDPSLPLFFPTILTSSDDSSSNRNVKDPFTTLKTNYTHWRTSGWWRTLSEDQIRERWSLEKEELTKGWKRRFREGWRVGRRRRGVGGTGGGGGDNDM